MRKAFVILFSLFVFLFINRPAYAEMIDSFDVTVAAQKDGVMKISENIYYDFEDLNKHGIYRFIPLYAKVGDLYRIINVKNIAVTRDGENENFEVSKNKEQINFKIGSANKTISGKHLYTITYDVENGIGSNFPDFDEIYWNATGNSWEVPITKASIRFTNEQGIKELGTVCFTGSYGSTEKNCEVNSATITTNQTLPVGYGLSGAVKYPKGSFPPSQLSKEPPMGVVDKAGNFYFNNIISFWSLINLVIPIILLIWYQKHKNKKRFGKPSVNFDIPEDNQGKRLIPALAGIIDSAKLERDDVVATLFDLAIRKYLKFENIKTKRSLLPDTNDQKIIKLKEVDKELNAFELVLFDRLFKDGNDVLVSDLKKDFYKTFNNLEKEAFSILVELKFYIKNPKTQKILLIILAFFALFTFNLILGVVLFFLSFKLIGRTELGDEMDFKIDGLKLFLKSMDRNYKWQAEKFYTVEAMIPYAMSLGYIDKFMEQLKIIKPDYNPSWYRGYSGGFYLSYGAFLTSINSNMTTSAPSSSSGSHGGFSGGGGGGGGGGSW